MSKTTGRRIAASAIAAVLLLSACGDDSGDSLEGTVVEDGLGCTLTRVDRPTEAPALPTVEPDAEPVTEVASEDLVEPEEGACDGTVMPYLTLDMLGVKASDGTQFVSTYGAERPITVQLGQGQMLPGLETGLVDLKVGGRRQITVPAAEAYGAEGNPAQGIGPDETLIFVVDLVTVGTTAEFCNENLGIPPAPEGIPGGEGKPTEKIDMPLHPVEELGITTIREGTGAEVKEGDDVELHYVGISCASGQQFESSWDAGETLPATAGGEGLIEGFSKGIVGTKVGELRRIDIPAEQAYGDDALTFLIEVTAIVPPTETTDPADPADPTATTEPGETTDTTAADETTTTAAG